MKLAIFSDVHSNSKAFSIAYKDAKENHGCDSVVCLGDVVGYGPDPIGSIEEVRSKCDFCLLGNHDAGVTGKLRIEWFGETAANVIRKQKPMLAEREEHSKWLKSLNYMNVMDVGDVDNRVHLQFTHGNNYFPEEFEYITCSADSKLAFDRMAKDGIDILFVGHTHEPAIISQKKNDDLDWYDNYPSWIVVEGNKKVKVDTNERIIVNVGSVGYPRICHHSVYGILDTDEMTIEWVFLPFDFLAYGKSLRNNNIKIPNWLGWHLETHLGVYSLD